MSSESPFYLSSSESRTLLAPRRCIRLERLTVPNRDDYLRVSIDPPIIGQPFGLGDKDIDELVLATRHQGTSLFPVSEWPLTVYYCRILNDKIKNSGKATAQDIEAINVGMIYPTYSDAKKSLKYLEDIGYTSL